MLTRVYNRVLAQTRPASPATRLAVTALITVAALLLREALTPIMPEGYPFLLSAFAVLLSAALFDFKAGVLSVAIGCASAAYFYFPPLYSFRVHQLQHLVALWIFAGYGVATSAVLETLHNAVARLQRVEQRRLLLLLEYRHRSRNDLATLSALLLLRARGVDSEPARQALRDAARHTRMLATVHAGLAAAAQEDPACVDTRAFLTGLCASLAAGEARPLQVDVRAEAHTLDSERGVPLGMLVAKLLVDDGRARDPGPAGVLLVRDGADLVLVVSDSRPPDPARQATDVDARVLGALASQIRGAFHQAPREGGGTVSTTRFAAEAPRAAAQLAG